MNAGAWGVEMKDVTCSVSFLSEDGEIVERSRSRLKFSYRKLDFPSSWVILKGRFRLKRGVKEEILERMRSYSEMRQKKHPLDYPSAGSIFKNPPGDFAGRLIEAVGLKGRRHGGAMISPQHANFIVNVGAATAADVRALMDDAVQRVSDVTGVRLEPEIKLVGDWSGT